MTEQNPMPIVVAVGDDSIDSALAFAAAEAVASGCGVHLLHAVHLFVQGGDTVFAEPTDEERLGRKTLNAALERMREIADPATRITSDLQLGGVVATLVAESEDARMIVLEHRDLSRMKRIVTRSVAGGVAARARVPVVSVPTGYTAAAADAPVTVGVDAIDQSEQLLRVAGATAKRRGAPLHVVHTWSFPNAYDDLVMSNEEETDWRERAELEIQALLDGLGEEVAGVPVRIEARHARAAEALVDASRTSQLVVVGRHDPLMPIGSHVGPVARALLHTSACPVMLLDTQPE
jgi:nucleotide-binding universal stress UspA family protein